MYFDYNNSTGGPAGNLGAVVRSCDPWRCGMASPGMSYWINPVGGGSGQLVPKSTRTQDNSYPRQLVPKTTRTQDNSYPRQLVPKTTRTQDNSYPGQLVPRWYDMKWCDMIWCDVMRRDMMWYDMIRYDIISYIWYDTILCDTISCHIISRYDVISYHIISYHILYNVIFMLISQPGNMYTLNWETFRCRTIYSFYPLLYDDKNNITTYDISWDNISLPNWYLSK